MSVSKMSTDYHKKIEELKNYLDFKIGYYYYDSYYNSWFWNNISMPINLALTLSTALMAAQASSTGSLLSENDYMILSFTTMILTTVNSYFKPQIKSMDSGATLTKWVELGYKLDNLLFENKCPEDLYKDYKDLFTDMHKQASSQAGSRNFLTSWWHYGLRKLYGPKSENWIKGPLSGFKNKNEINGDTSKRNDIVIEMTEIKKSPESLVSIIARQSESV
jgi:hypothetical protein